MRYVIIIPGIGDDREWLTRQTDYWESAFGLEPVLYPLSWKDRKISFVKRLSVLESQIDELLKEGEVSLLGISAGGSLAINGFLQRPKVTKAVSVCGRLRDGGFVFPPLRLTAAKFPAFYDCVRKLEQLEPSMSNQLRSKITTIRGAWDELVPGNTAVLEGAFNIRIPSREHWRSIEYTFQRCSVWLTDYLKA